MILNYQSVSPIKIFIFLFWLIVSVYSLVSTLFYNGNTVLFIVFTAIFHANLIYSFRRNALFFETFFSTFLWIGFWFQLSHRIIFFDSKFNEYLYRYFKGEPYEFDGALVVSIVGLFGVMFASYFREKIIYKNHYNNKLVTDGLYHYFNNYRKIILFFMMVIIMIVGYLNYSNGIYQRGVVSKTVLPFGLNGVFTWFLLFGAATFSSVFIKADLVNYKSLKVLTFVFSIIEAFISSVSMLSRAMILNNASLFYGAYREIVEKKIEFRIFSIAIIFIFFIVVFSLSIVSTSELRKNIYSGKQNVDIMLTHHVKDVKDVKDPATYKKYINYIYKLVVDRWVGIDGVLAVNSYPHLGWDTLEKAWKEEYTGGGTTYYDKHIINSGNIYIDAEKHHFVTLPGMIAFLFYSGNYWFLLIGMFTVSIIGSLIEIFVYNFAGRNLILCSLIGQVIAYRYINFGYVPQRTYILITAIILNIIILYSIYYFFNKQNTKIVENE